MHTVLQRFSLWSLVAIIIGGTFFNCLSFVSPVYAANISHKECETERLAQDTQPQPMSMSSDTNVCPIILFAKQVSSERNGITVNSDVWSDIGYEVLGIAYGTEQPHPRLNRQSIIAHKPPSLIGTILKRE